MTEQQNRTKNAVKELYTKAILMAVALILLVAALVFFTTAWYTKMVSTAGMNFQAAQWDFTANHTVDAINVGVYEYATMSDDKRVAPGTAGYIPIKLGAQQSHTDISYTLTVDRTTMSKEFQDRIFFYYIKKNEDGTTVRVYFDGSPDAPAAGAEDKQPMTGRVSHTSSTTVNIYWEWIYEAPASATDEEKKAWDEFDTKVGMDPEAYTKDMNATITVAGVEINHEKETPKAPDAAQPGAS